MIRALAALLLVAVALAGGWFALGWYGPGPADEDSSFIVRSGSTLTSVAGQLEEQGLIENQEAFLLRAKVLGSGDPIKAGEFLLEGGLSPAAILDTLQHGDVIRRSRITPDGREYVLVYVEEDNYDRVRDWRDPGDDLPPMRLNIPRRQYILESEYVDGPEDYYDFLEQPPVEKVQRLYSIDEVKRSARVRDIARRVDLDTLTFEFGSATIPDSEIAKLEGVATAMGRLLEKNPAETFLIEGHTDAVGSDTANLALSDRRAEAVAEALSNVFDIRYLKVKTEAPERQNRRVAIRRITPLVAPVASAN